MQVSTQIAKQFRDVQFGGNWTSVNMKGTLTDVTWQQAITKVHSFNTIATIVFHIGYYVSVVTKVLQGEALSAKDEYSFNAPPITSEQDWKNLLDKTFSEAETFAGLLEQLPESKMEEVFVNEKYGTYYRNLHGIIEHTHYHLGQIVLIKKILSQQETSAAN